MSKLGAYFLAILIWLDEGLNTLIIGLIGLFINIPVPSEGDPHYTVSQVLGFLRARGSRVGCVGCAILTWIQNKVLHRAGDHCTQAVDGMPDDLAP